MSEVWGHPLVLQFVSNPFISKSGYALINLLDFYNKKYGKLGSNLVHIHKSLVFFDDAEPDEMPRMLKSVPPEKRRTGLSKKTAGKRSRPRS